MHWGSSEKARSLLMLAVVCCFAYIQPGFAANDDDEEPVDLGSYDGTQTRTQIERPAIVIERPQIQTDFQVDLSSPTATPALPTLNLTDALVAPTATQATTPANPPPTSSPARQATQQPTQQPVQQPRTAAREPAAPPPQQRAATPPPSQPAASAGPRIVPISMDAPSYPTEAQRAGTVGYVTVAFTIRADGSVDDVEVVEDQPRGIFRRAAQRAVRRWRFEPIIVNGRATEYRVQHRIDFNLED
jgi:TonB family protein